jgi:tetratricopeptide (TPR) repeat protein
MISIGIVQVFLAGQVETEPDIHDRLIKVIQSSYRDSDAKDQSAVNFKSVALEQALPEKKPPKDNLSAEGILKYNWPSKHYELVPSVLLFTVAFSVDWSISEWIRKETWIQDRYNRLRALTAARDIKIIVVVVKVGMGATDKEAMDERMNSLKRHLQLDSRTFHLITGHDISTNSANMKKVSKYVKEYSSMYYINKIKGLKAGEKSVGERYKGLEENILLARTYFKIAFFYEFQAQQLQSLRYYRQAYTALCACADTATGDLLEQVKAVAEIVHFKICHILLLTNSIGETFMQFKAHIKRFAGAASSNLWRHYAWLADQYVVFAELMQQFSISDALPDADRGYYYQNAARYNQKRQASFEKVRASRPAPQPRSSKKDGSGRTRHGSGGGEEDGEQYRSSFHGMILVAPRFVGSAIQFEEPLMDTLHSMMPSKSTYTEYLIEQEMGVQHGAVVMQLLNMALEKTNYAFVRRRGMLQYLIAQLHMQENAFDRALECLKSGAELLCEESWTLPAVTVLSQWSQCALLLGRPQEYLDAALALYANAGQNVLSRHEVEKLHLNVMSLFAASLASPSEDAAVKVNLSDSAFLLPKFPVRNRAAFLTTSAVPLQLQAEYGSFGNSDSNSSTVGGVQYSLTRDHIVELSAEHKQMFDLRVAFDQKAVELGQSVLVTLTLRSRFIDEVVFDEMKLHFTDGVVVKRFIGTDNLTPEVVASLMPSARNSPVKPVFKSGSAESLNERDTNNTEVQVSNADTIYTSLALPPKRAVDFSFYVYISEPCFSKFTAPEAILCLERVELYWHSSSRIKELRLHGATPQTAQTGAEQPRSASVVLRVNAFPPVLQRAVQEVTLAAGKPQSLKDLCGFCAHEGFGALTVRKPNALITLMEPVQTVNLLQSIVQRVNVYLKIGQSDVLDGYVYLSSTHTAKSAADSLFWYPDRRQLEGCGGGADDAHLDKVLLHPMQISAAGQPVQPVHIPAPIFGPSGADCVICVPLYVKCDAAKSVSITLRVEFEPKGILRSSLTKDFSLAVNFLSPFDVRYALGRDGSAQDMDAATFAAGRPSVLSTSLVCLNSLQHAVGVVDMRLFAGDRKSPQDGAIAILDNQGRTSSSAVLLHGETPLPLRSQELVTRTVHLTHIPAVEAPVKQLSAYQQLTQKAPSSQASTTAPLSTLSAGRLEVSWRILQSHILRRPFVPLSAVSMDSPLKSSPRSPATPGVGLSLTGDFDWLHTLGRLREGQVITPEEAGEGDMRFLDLTVSVCAVCRVAFPVPELKVLASFKSADLHCTQFLNLLCQLQVNSSPFLINVAAPPQCGLMDVTSVGVTIKSLQNTLERVRVNVVPNDAFLLTGPTLTVLEVSNDYVGSVYVGN